MPPQTSRKRRYFRPPLDEAEILRCFMLGARYDEGRNELFISDWQQPHAFVPFLANGTVPELTDIAITGTRDNVTEVNFGWSVDETSHRPKETEAQQRRSFMSNKNVYLDCPYQDKDDCKALGGRWDPDVRKWYVPEGLDLDPFRLWISDDLHKKVTKAFAPAGHPLSEG